MLKRIRRRRRPAPPKSEPNAYRLTSKIVELSEADTWDAAKLEWTLDSIYFTDKPGQCLCGHRPIIEHCVLVNRHNRHQVVVGNVCVTKFLGLPSNRLFSAIHRIAADPTRALNAETVEYAHGKYWLNEWERNFYMDTLRKRKLTEKQTAKREELNNLVLWGMGIGR